MKFGINTFLYSFPFNNAGAKMFKKYKAWGFDAVEIAVDDPANIDTAFLKQELDKVGLECCSVCACMGPGRDFRGSAQDQKTAMDYLKTLIDQAVALGCNRVIGPVYSVVGRTGPFEQADYKAQWQLVVKNLKELCKYAESKGVLICMEPLNRFETNFINTVDQGLKMIKDVKSPAFKLHLDTFHMNIEEKCQGEAIKKAGKLIGHIHACGSDRGTPGNDHICWDSIAKALKAVKYDGPVVIESFTQDVKIIAAAAAIWRKIEPSREEIAVKGLKNLRKALK
jgi:D-psicose/D-tagatose/L-ribulose 3-epimerase